MVASSTTTAKEAQMATQKLSTKQAIEKVLTGKRKRMTVAQIADEAIPLTNLKGATPKQTFYSVLYGENRKKDGLVIKVGPGGTFKLNPKRKSAAKPAAAKATTSATTSKRSSTKPAAAKS
jgi:hypothetical protein